MQRECRVKGEMCKKGRDVFFNGGVIVIEMFSYAVMDEACCATNVLLIAVVARVLVHCISS